MSRQSTVRTAFVVFAFVLLFVKGIFRASCAFPSAMGDIPYMTMSLLVALLNIAPFCWQVEHRNSGPVALGFWTILLNLTNFVGFPSMLPFY
jgi:hypothetical protein